VGDKGALPGLARPLSLLLPFTARPCQSYRPLRPLRQSSGRSAQQLPPSQPSHSSQSVHASISCSLLPLTSTQINDAAISTFLTTMDPLEWSQELTSSQGGIRLPLRFSSPIEELNFISTLSLLNCLSGHRAAFHRLTSRGAYSTLLSLLLSSYLSPLPTTPLTTSGMCASSPASLASLAQIMTHTEKDHPTMGPIVKIGEKDEEAWEILESWTKVLKETGTILKVLKYESLGEWVAETLGETGGDAGAFLVEVSTGRREEMRDGTDGVCSSWILSRRSEMPTR
jgi:hypothetical protein